MRSILSRSVSLITVATLAACGGGGGSGGDVGTPVEGSPITLAAGNYVGVSTEAYAAALDTVSSGADGSGLLTGAQVTAAPAWGAYARQQVSVLAARFLQTPAQLAGVTSQDTVSCPQGGTITFSISDQNANQALNAGDSVSATATDCQVDGETSNGSLTITMNTEPGGDVVGGTIYSFDATISFTNFSVASAAVSASATGSLRMISLRTAQHLGTDTVTATAFSSTVNIDGSSRTRALNSLSATVAYSPTETATSVSGSLGTSPVLGVYSVSFATSSPFKRLYADNYPYSGVGVVTGASGGKAWMTALDNTQVRFDLDADGDGTAEASSTVAWSAIR
jgi:hypothetical protein